MFLASPKQVVAIGETLLETLEAVGSKLGVQVEGLQCVTGGLIDEFTLIR